VRAMTSSSLENICDKQSYVAVGKHWHLAAHASASKSHHGAYSTVGTQRTRGTRKRAAKMLKHNTTDVATHVAVPTVTPATLRARRGAPAPRALPM
jgi:hypothetical protein